MNDTLLDKWQALLTALQTTFAQMPNPLTMDWHALHFLRPGWFYGFIPLVLLFLVLLKKHQNSQNWKKVCDAQLLPHILTTQKGKKSYLPVFITFIAASLCLTALAGPVLKKLPQPVFREQSALVVLLDLSQSMDAQDIKPSRIERAKLELLDILAKRRGGQTALIVYAADAFTVTPLTDDNATIANLVPSLETSMMPAQGSSLDIALKKAQDLFTQSGLTFGDILLVTDDIHQRYNQTIKEVSDSGFRVSIFAIGTEQGGPIPLSNGFLKDKSGAIVIPKLDAQKLQKMALAGHGLYVNIDAGEQDTILLTDLFQSSLIHKNEDSNTKNTTDNAQTNINADVWQEEGVWLLFPLIFFAALWARKGWLVLVIVLTILSDTPPAYADENIETTDSKNVLNNLWLTPNQKGMQAFENGDLKKAADEFKRSDWKASALYRNGDFEQAAELFDNNIKQNTSDSSTSDNLYNKGNALAKAGKYEEAITAYEKAIELNADNEDAAYNKELVKDALKKQQEEQKKQEQSDKKDGDKNEDKKDEKNNDKNDESKDQKDGDNSEEKNGDPQDSDGKNGKQQDKQNSDENKDQQQDKQQQSPDDEKEPKDKQKQTGSDEQEQKKQDEALKQRTPDDQDSKNKKQEQEQLKQEDQKKDNKKNKDLDSENNSDEKNKPQEVQEINPREASVSEDEQAIEQWLRRIQDDPGGLLRRKFLYQYKNVPNQKDSDQPW